MRTTRSNRFVRVTAPPNDVYRANFEDVCKLRGNAKFAVRCWCQPVITTFVVIGSLFEGRCVIAISFDAGNPSYGRVTESPSFISMNCCVIDAECPWILRRVLVIYVSRYLSSNVNQYNAVFKYNCMCKSPKRNVALLNGCFSFATFLSVPTHVLFKCTRRACMRK